ncbi:VWA domain-containing protein [Aurantimonas sp. A2-1-M11]|uniref:VWA domain-containing protein n=1 Tax=Aurantimonas sp. A2-1-M11 TaxID=3113712 RepID=UPI002F95FC06
MKKTVSQTIALAFLLGAIACTAPEAAAEDENVMIVFDGSNSMWGQIDGTAKIEIARGVMENLLGDWTESRQVGLMAYGHRRRGDCSDIETLVAPEPDTRTRILDRIGAITPTGKTPLTGAVEQAATVLSYTDTPATVILISDGLESCDRDPCTLAKTLETRGIGFTAHVVGFGLGDADASALSCIAEETGGRYISAGNADELGDALAAVGSAVVDAAPEPAPAPEPQYDVTLTAPGTALAGSAFDVSWTGTVAGSDFITVVPMGADEGSQDNHFRVRDNDEHQLRAPAETGLYEVRYVLNEGRRTLASQPIEVTEPEVTLTVPGTALAGSAFDVSWTGTVAGSDFITVVPMGADEGSQDNHFRVRDNDEHRLRAPGETGLYEVRYVLNEGRRTLASQPIEVTDPKVTLTAPDSALAGSAFDVSWTGTVAGGDFITVVPMGADEGSQDNHFRVRDNDEHQLRAPAETGFYEVRYVRNEGRRTLASQPIEVTEPEVTLTAPDKIRAGDPIQVSWTGGVSGGDFVTVVPMGAEEGRQDGHFRVRDNSEDELRAPAETGMYEIRYVLNEGRRTLARQPIEILAEDASLENGATLEAPDSAVAGTTIDVGWSTTRGSADQRITLARADQAIFTWITAVRIEGDRPVAITLPDAPGGYELRFLDVAKQEILARHAIQVN